jgi:hypothetical protein
MESVLLAGMNVAGVCMFTAEHVYGSPYELTLVQDSADHAEIMGVPLMSENEQRAIDIAHYLVGVSQDVPITEPHMG